MATKFTTEHHLSRAISAETASAMPDWELVSTLAKIIAERTTPARRGTDSDLETARHLAPISDDEEGERIFPDTLPKERR